MSNNEQAWVRLQIERFLTDNPKGEIAAVWYGKEDADWSVWYDEVGVDPDCEFTDDEWVEIAGRFNEMDWQYVSEEFDEICRSVLEARIST
jgi:hypothetical protein